MVSTKGNIVDTITLAQGMECLQTCHILGENPIKSLASWKLFMWVIRLTASPNMKSSSMVTYFYCIGDLRTKIFLRQIPFYLIYFSRIVK